jgi:hypothetical protein
MCKSLPAYGTEMAKAGPSPILVNWALVHAATMHIDAKVLRVAAGACCAEGDRERRSASAFFPSRGVGLCVPGDTGRAFSESFKVPMGNKSGGGTVLISGGRSSRCAIGDSELVGRDVQKSTVYGASLSRSCHSYKYHSDLGDVTNNT